MEKLPPAEIRSFLAEETLFRGASARTIDELTRLAVQRHVAHGTVLFTMGQRCDFLWFVVDGCGALTKVSPDGRERVLHRATRGEMVGGVPFFDEGDYPATFFAESDSLVVGFERDGFIALLSRDPSLSLSIIGGLVLRLRQMVNLVEQISFDDTQHRLWRFLIDSSEPNGTGEFPRTVLSLPTRENIASTIGTVREVVSRRLSRLVDTGHIRIEGRRVVLLKQFV